jgi:trk system potassium uptake protein TrkA
MSYNSLIRELGVDVAVNPGAIIISQILQYMRHGKIEAVHSLHEGMIEIFEATALITSSLVGNALKDAKIPKGIVVGAIVRNDTVIMGRPTTVVQEDDKVIVMSHHVDAKKVEKIFSVSASYF